MLKLRDPVVKKHVHSWGKTGERFSPVFVDGKRVTRKCSECSLIQWADIRSENLVPDSVIHLADAEWV